jgi:hypothetical protein
MSRAPFVCGVCYSRPDYSKELGVESCGCHQAWADYGPVIEAAKALGACWVGQRIGLAEKINSVAFTVEALLAAEKGD